MIYLFANQGIVTTGFFDRLSGWDINLYGANGIIMGEVLYCFPQALVILITALSLTDARLYEAAEVLRTPKWRTFLTVTIPSVKYGLISAIFVCFTLAFTDFGVPKVVGGDFNVLATDIYKQPMSLPAILEIGIYYFVNAMITISAIIFIYPSDLPLAAVAIVNMDDAGDIAPAAAMSTLLVFTSIGVRIIYWLLTQKLQQNTQAWLKR